MTSSEGRLATPTTSSEGNVTTPAPRSAASVSGGRVTPVTVLSVDSRIPNGSGVSHRGPGDAISPPVLDGMEAARRE